MVGSSWEEAIDGLEQIELGDFGAERRERMPHSGPVSSIMDMPTTLI